MAKRNGFRVVLGLAVLLVLGGSVEAQRPNAAMNLPTRQLLNRYGLERNWWNRAVTNPSSDTIRHLSADEELTYVQSSRGLVTTFDNATGKRRWATLLGRGNQPAFQAVSNQQIVLIAMTVKLFAIDKWSGEVVWELDLQDAPSASPGLDDRRVYVGTREGSVYAYNLETVRELHAEELLPDWSKQALSWRYQTGAPITTPPISNDRTVNFASHNGSLYSVEKRTRDLLFQFETNAPISAPMTRVNDFVYMASEDFDLYCVNAESGQVRWEFTAGLPIRQGPRVIGEHVFLVPFDGGMYCLNAASGAQLWWHPKVTQFLAATPSRVYASDEMGNVLILSRQDGSVVGALPLRNFSVRFPNDRTDRILLTTPGGIVASIRELGREFPIYHKHPQRQPILPEFAPEPEEQSSRPSDNQTIRHSDNQT